jgi:hypothetical protein
VSRRVAVLRARIDQLGEKLPKRPPPPGGVDFSSLRDEEFLELDMEALNIDQLDELRAELRVRYKLSTGQFLTDETAREETKQAEAETERR